MIELSEKGYWWIDSEDDHKVPGLLTFSQDDGGAVELFGELNQASRPSEAVEDVEVINGRLIDGPMVHLYNCKRVDGVGGTSTIAGEGFSYSSGTYSINKILVSEYDIKEPIKKIKIKFPELERWFNQDVIKPIKIEDNRTHGFQYSVPAPIRVEFDDYRISLQIEVHESISSASSVEMRQQASFKIILENGTNDLSVIQDFIQKISDLISFAVGDPVAPSKVKVAPAGGTPGTFHSGDLYYEMRGAQSSDEFVIHDSNFDLSDIAEDIENVLKYWMTGYQRIEPLFNLYFSVLRSDNMSIENQFLNLTQSIEVYHRRTYEENYISEEEFQKLKQDLVDTLPEELPNDFKMSLRHGTFEYANEYSLRKRLKELKTEYETVLSKHPKHNEDIVAQIVDTRNYHTHYDKEGRTSNVHEGSEILPLQNYLEHMTQILLFDEIGFVESEIISLLE